MQVWVISFPYRVLFIVVIGFLVNTIEVEKRFWSVHINSDEKRTQYQWDNEEVLKKYILSWFHFFSYACYSYGGVNAGGVIGNFRNEEIAYKSTNSSNKEASKGEEDSSNSCENWEKTCVSEHEVETLISRLAKWLPSHCHLLSCSSKICSLLRG